ALNDPNGGGPAAAVSASLGRRDTNLITILTKALADSEATVRSSALNFIANAFRGVDLSLQGKLVSFFFQDALRCLENPGTVEAAARVVAAMNAPGCIDTLKKHVHRHWSAQQLGSVIALGLMRDASAA